MISKVLIFIATLLVAVDARAFPDSNGKSLEQLISEFKEIEKVRHEAIAKASEKPEFKEDENMARYMAAWSEYDALLVEMRKALKDIPWLLETLHHDEEDTGKGQRIMEDFKRLRQKLQVVEEKLLKETRNVPAELLLDKDFVKVIDTLDAGSKKLLQIGLKMLVEVTLSLLNEDNYAPSVLSANQVI